MREARYAEAQASGPKAAASKPKMPAKAPWRRRRASAERRRGSLRPPVDERPHLHPRARPRRQEPPLQLTGRRDRFGAMIELTKGQELPLTTDDGRPLGQSGWASAGTRTGRRLPRQGNPGSTWTPRPCSSPARRPSTSPSTTTSPPATARSSTRATTRPAPARATTRSSPSTWRRSTPRSTRSSSWSAATRATPSSGSTTPTAVWSTTRRRARPAHPHAGVPETGAVMAKLVRTGDGWTLHAIGEGIAVTVPTKSVNALLPYV